MTTLLIDATGSSWKIASRVFAAVAPHTDMQKPTSPQSMFIDRIIAEHVKLLSGKVFELCKLASKMEVDSQVYVGDADVFLHCLVNTLSDGDGRLVLHGKNVCTCRDDNEWLLVYGTGSPLAWGSNEAHLRKLFTNSDYRPNERNSLTSRPNLQFHKDRDYVIDYIKKYHMSNLGGIYGDGRDHGYAGSFIEPAATPDPSRAELLRLASERHMDGYHHCYQDFQAIMFDIMWLINENPFN